MNNLEYEQMKIAMDLIGRTALIAKRLSILAIIEDPGYDENNQLITGIESLVGQIGWIADKFAGAWASEPEDWFMPPVYPHTAEEMAELEAFRREACREDVESGERSGAGSCPVHRGN